MMLPQEHQAHDLDDIIEASETFEVCIYCINRYKMSYFTSHDRPL